MVFAHMDQLGFIVRKIEPSGLIRLERQGGVPERALPAQAVLLCTEAGDLPGVISNKSHHATTPDEKYQVVPYARLAVDAGFASKEEAEAAGVRIGTPVVYQPRAIDLAGGRMAGTAVDDRAGCAALIALAEARQGKPGPTLHLVWSVQEEHNLRGVLPAATSLAPDIAISIDTAARLRHAGGRRSRRRRAGRWSRHVPLLVPRPRYAQRRHPAPCPGAPHGRGGGGRRGAPAALGAYRDC